MEKSLKQWAQSLFDSIKHVDKNGHEYWLARELADVLGYSWEGFEKVVTRAEISVAETGMPVENHFRHVSKMKTIGRGNERPVPDVELTRYACYIVAQNGNAAKKPAIAAAQAYFATQTRKQELIEQRESVVWRWYGFKKPAIIDSQVTAGQTLTSMRVLRFIKLVALATGFEPATV